MIEAPEQNLEDEKDFEVPANQTIFSRQEPLMEEVYDILGEKAAAARAAANKLKTPWWKQKMVLGIGGVVFLLVVVIVVAVINRPAPKKLIVEPTPSPEPKLEVPDEMTQRLLKAKQLLNQADPNQNPLPFPQVDMKLQLEDEK